MDAMGGELISAYGSLMRVVDCVSVCDFFFFPSLIKRFRACVRLERGLCVIKLHVSILQ